MKDSRADALPLGNGALVDYIAREKSFRGIGPRRAEALAIAFGPDLKAAILRLDVGVIEIIGEASAIAAAAAMEVREAETAFLAWLAEIDAKIPNAKAIRLARAWGPEGVEAARQNPYLLLAVADWRAVDAIARATGVDHDDPRRDVAALEAAMTGDACLGRGSTRVPVTAALRSAERLLGSSTIIGTVETSPSLLEPSCGSQKRSSRQAQHTWKPNVLSASRASRQNGRLLA